jgi:hypothetical protein
MQVSLPLGTLFRGDSERRLSVGTFAGIGGPTGGWFVRIAAATLVEAVVKNHGSWDRDSLKGRALVLIL